LRKQAFRWDFDAQSASQFNGLQPNSAIITLTQQDSAHTTSARGNAGAPEITPTMIEAGVAAYAATRPGEASDFGERRIVAAIFEAMAKASECAVRVLPRGQ
jgi:hypothetical protein